LEKILIVDDNAVICTQLKWGLAEEYSVLQGADGVEGLALFREHAPRVVILDLGLPPHANSEIEGFRCLGEMLTINPSAKIIMLTGNDERKNALKAIQMGAYDFYPKPPCLSELKVIISRAIHLANIEEQNRQLQRSIELTTDDSWGMIGQCPEMQKVFANIRKVASTNVPIFIGGESGTGKELVAKALHDASGRNKAEFVAVNCGAIPENLMESEFFGHEKGAFTGAHSTVQGKFQQAHKGTLFLDEIGELPLNLQVKLLRFLQEGVLQRVGGRENIAVNARTICATNIDINAAIKEGQFREDLFYRIGVIIINLPPLRERGDDIMLMANFFMRLFSEEYNKRVRRFSASALSFLKSHPWPGNVRELRNRVQRAVIMGETKAIEAVDLGCDLPEQVDLVDTEVSKPLRGRTLREAKDQVERDLVIEEMERHEGNIVKTADVLGVSRPTLYGLLKKHGLVVT
jgi:two-component system, NtrC family, response regulator